MNLDLFKDCDAEALKEIEELQVENERLEREVNRLEANEELLADEQVKILDERDGLREENAKLRYALARLRWEHAGKVESLIDELYTIRPSSWRFYYKSKTYWFKKWQELKKALKEGK